MNAETRVAETQNIAPNDAQSIADEDSMSPRQRAYFRQKLPRDRYRKLVRKNDEALARIDHSPADASAPCHA